MRLDRALADLMEGHSREAVKRMIAEGRVRLRGKPCLKPRLQVAEDTEVEINLSGFALASDVPEPEDIGLEIVCADAELIVVNKKPGIVVCPARGNRSGTLLNGLLALYPELEALPRAGIVHRLDKDTSGVLVVARTARAMQGLSGQFREREVVKEYLALVHGIPPGTGRIELPIGRDRNNRLRMAVAVRGRDALTTYRVMERFAGCCLLACRIHTGRTHQIRVHLESAGHPVVGDRRYCRRAKDMADVIGRHALHAWKIALRHPSTQESVRFACDMPQDMQDAIALLKSNA